MRVEENSLLAGGWVERAAVKRTMKEGKRKSNAGRWYREQTNTVAGRWLPAAL